jgi:hypothetical protein
LNIYLLLGFLKGSLCIIEKNDGKKIRTTVTKAFKFKNITEKFY